MAESILEAVVDAVKTLPFLFVAYLLIEYIEHHMQNVSVQKLLRKRKASVCIASVLGAVPQCGFSVTASNLYATHLISVGTLLAVFLATSDEAVPILMAEPKLWTVMAGILVLKVLIGLVAGLLVDMFWKGNHHDPDFYDVCGHCHCEEEKGIVKPALLHTVKMFGFLLVINLILVIMMDISSDAVIRTLFLHGSVFQPFVAALVGLIPNCGPSVALTQLYVQQQISFGSLVAGLCSGAGLGTAVLFKVNQDKKENIMIVLLLYGIAVVTGLVLNLSL